MQELMLTLMMIAIVASLIGILNIKQGFTCDTCTQKYDQPVTKGYDYHTEYYCPHCGTEQDFSR